MNNTEISLRRARKADQTAINKLVRDAGINPFGLKWSRFVVAVGIQQQIIGCGQVKRHRNVFRELASIAAHRDWRNQGVAQAIIRELHANCEYPLWLTCMDRLVPFYRRFGFRTIDDSKQMPRFFRSASRFFNLYLKLARTGGKLALMVWDEPL